MREVSYKNRNQCLDIGHWFCRYVSNISCIDYIAEKCVLNDFISSKAVYVITSRYIRKMPRMNWKMYDYIRCDCKTLNIAVHTGTQQTLEICKGCGQPLASHVKTFIIPQFGFECDGDISKRPGLTKPERIYRGEISYVGYRNDTEHIDLQIGNASIELLVSRADEMAMINESGFYVCSTCGYTDLDEKTSVSHMRRMATVY